jgi:hypothetical protein
MKIGILVSILVFLGTASFIGSRDLPRLWKLSHNGQFISAKVVKLEPENHNTYFYSYVVNSRAYIGDAFIPPAGVKLGQQIRIVYSPDNPEWSSDQKDLNAAFKNELFFSLIATVFGSVVLTAGVLRSLNITLEDAFSRNVSIKKADIIPWFQWRDTGGGDKP